MGVGLPSMAGPTHQPLFDFGQRHLAIAEIFLHPPNTTEKSPDVFFHQQPMRGEHSIAEKANALLDRKDRVLSWVKFQPQSAEKSADLFTGFRQLPLVVREQQKIIDIAHIALEPQSLFDEVIERIEIHVGEELTGLVADGDASASFAVCEQIIAGKVMLDFFLWITAVDDASRQPQHVRVFDLAGDLLFEDVVIHRRKEFTDVGLEHITKATGELLASIATSSAASVCFRRDCFSLIARSVPSTYFDTM